MKLIVYVHAAAAVLRPRRHSKRGQMDLKQVSIETSDELDLGVSEEDWRLATSIRQRTERLGFGGECAGSPGRGLLRFLERIVKVDPLVKELADYVSASGAMVICSDSWQHMPFGWMEDSSWSGYRMLALTASGFRVVTIVGEKGPKSDGNGMVRQDNTVRLVVPFSHMNILHANKLAGASAEPAAERILGYLHRFAETLVK